MPRRGIKKNTADECRKDGGQEAPGTNLDERKPGKVGQVDGQNIVVYCSIFDENSIAELDLRYPGMDIILVNCIFARQLKEYVTFRYDHGMYM